MTVLTRVMVVDDEPDIRRVLEVALHEVAGFDLAVCGSAAEALETAPAFRPELILLDVMMPKMDGPALLAALRELPAVADAPVVFLTGRVQPEEVARLRALGALGVMPKPFDPITLADHVTELWEQRREQA